MSGQRTVGALPMNTLDQLCALVRSKFGHRAVVIQMEQGWSVATVDRDARNHDALRKVTPTRPSLDALATWVRYASPSMLLSVES